MTWAPEFGVQCNVRAPHRFMRFGALCTIVNYNPGNGGDHVEVWGMTRGGRMTRTWIDARDLSNYRAKWIPDTGADWQKWARSFETKEAAAEQATWLQQNYGDTPMRDLRPTR
jgi:hypothetical protein